MKTKKQNFYSALQNKDCDTLVWAPNFDWWYNVNKRNGTLPDKYRHMTRHDICREIDAAIWQRVGMLKTVYDGVTVKAYNTETDRRIVYETPRGCLEEHYEKASDASGTYFLKGHLIRNVDDIKIAKYIAQATDFEPDYEGYFQQLEQVGDNGIVLTQEGRSVPFIDFGKTDVGWENGLYMWTDYKTEVDDLLKAYTDRALRQYSTLADSPVTVIESGDNMDQSTFPPYLFEEYAIPYYQQVSEILHKKNKIHKVHWCGQTQNLLHYLTELDIDVVEAVSVEPMAPLSLREALDKLEGKVVLQGGIAAVMVCHEGGSYDDFIIYMNKLLDQIQPSDSIVLGMSDNVPANADFSRVEAVSRILQGRGFYK